MLTIGKKLLFGIVFMLLLLVIIVLAGINSINNLSKTANNMETEYYEVNITHGLQISFQQILLSLKNYQLNENDREKKIKYYLSKAKEEIANSKKVITDNHNKKYLINYENDIIIVESLSQQLFKLDQDKDKITADVLMKEINNIARLAINELDDLSVESEKEMNKYILSNSKTNTKGRESIILIGIITACSLIIGSFFFLRSIMKPINHLMQTTQKISSDNLSANTPIETHDEIGSLVQSFNTMIGVLSKTTVSRDYFDNILSRMDDSLIITDVQTKIKVINQASLDLLGYTEEEIVGLPFSVILGQKDNMQNFTKSQVIIDILNHKHLHNIYNTYYTKNGEKIPVLFSGSLMYNKKGNVKGIICIASHHTVSKKVQAKTSLDHQTKPDKQTFKTLSKIPLTKREKEIMKLIADELNNQQIAEKLFISVRTVETHRKNIMHKLHIKNVVALVKYAALNEII